MALSVGFDVLDLLWIKFPFLMNARRWICLDNVKL